MVCKYLIGRLVLPSFLVFVVAIDAMHFEGSLICSYKALLKVYLKHPL